METLRLIQETKSEKVPAKSLKERCVKTDDDLLDLFPLPSYFQVHFQHMHENIHECKSEVAELKEHVAKVDDKLERLMSLLSRPSNPAL